MDILDTGSPVLICPSPAVIGWQSLRTGNIMSDPLMISNGVPQGFILGPKPLMIYPKLPEAKVKVKVRVKLKVKVTVLSIWNYGNIIYRMAQIQLL